MDYRLDEFFGNNTITRREYTFKPYIFTLLQSSFYLGRSYRKLYNESSFEIGLETSGFRTTVLLVYKIQFKNFPYFPHLLTIYLIFPVCD